MPKEPVLSRINPAWQEAFYEPLDIFSILTYTREARDTLMDLGIELGMEEQVKAILEEAAKESSPTCLLRLLMVGILEIQTDHVRSRMGLGT